MYLHLQFVVVQGAVHWFVCQLKTDPAGEKQTNISVLNIQTIHPQTLNTDGRREHLLGLHQLLTLEGLVPLVSSTHAGAVDAPALLRVVALLGLELAVVLAVGVVDAVVVHEGRLHRLPSHRAGAEALLGSVHLSLHQEALGDH